jgi:uridine monophosphate synthetase
MSDSCFTDSTDSYWSEHSERNERSASASANEKALITVLKKEGCIIEGEFNLKNGETSNVYYDIKTIISHPALFRNICDSLIILLPKELINYNLIFGIPYGGLPIASYLSITNNKPLIYSRKTL